jgi:hypothetical protein
MSAPSQNPTKFTFDAGTPLNALPPTYNGKKPLNEPGGFLSPNQNPPNNLMPPNSDGSTPLQGPNPFRPKNPPLPPTKGGDGGDSGGGNQTYNRPSGLKVVPAPYKFSPAGSLADVYYSLPKDWQADISGWPPELANGYLRAYMSGDYASAQEIRDAAWKARDEYNQYRVGIKNENEALLKDYRKPNNLTNPGEQNGNVLPNPVNYSPQGNPNEPTPENNSPMQLVHTPIANRNLNKAMGNNAAGKNKKKQPKDAKGYMQQLKNKKSFQKANTVARHKVTDSELTYGGKLRV